MKEDGKRGLAPGLVFDGKAETIGLGHPFCRAQKNLALVLSFGNQHAVQADVIHDDPVREGAARYLAREFEHVDEQLGRGPYLLGETFSAADLYLHMVTRWCRRLERKASQLDAMASPGANE